MQNTYNFHYMGVNFIDFKPNYEITNKDVSLIRLFFQLCMKFDNEINSFTFEKL